MTRERRAAIEAELATCGEVITLPVDDVRDLLRSSKAYDPYARKLRLLEADRDDSGVRPDDALVDLESL